MIYYNNTLEAIRSETQSKNRKIYLLLNENRLF